jgi:hypothetical protein
MIARKLRQRLKRVTDALIKEADVDAAWLASVLLAAQDALEKGEIADFAVRVWRANQPPPDPTAEIRPTRKVANGRNLRRSVASHRSTRKRGPSPASCSGPARSTPSRPGH